MRRTLIIAGIAVLVVAIGVISYFLFFSGNAAPAGSTTSGNPFGNAAGNTPPGGTSGSAGTGASSGTALKNAAGGRLVEIDAGPVVPQTLALYIATSSPTSGQTASTTAATRDVAIRYIDERSGNMFSYLFYAKQKTQLTSTTIPGIHEAAWLPDGSRAFVRYLSDQSAGGQIATYSLPADASPGFFLASGVSELLVLPKSLLMLSASDLGSTVSTVSNDGSKSSILLTLPLSSVVLAPAGPDTLLAYTKASAAANGYAYLVNEKTGTWTKLLGPLPGLAVLPSPSGKFALASYDVNGIPMLELIEVGTGTITVLPLKTLADKCAWGASDAEAFCGVPTSLSKASYPDDWYQGSISFSDKLWKIDVSNHFAELLVDFAAQTGLALDARALEADSHDKLLVFTNKIDDSLWVYDL